MKQSQTNRKVGKFFPLEPLKRVSFSYDDSPPTLMCVSYKEGNSPTWQLSHQSQDINTNALPSNPQTPYDFYCLSQSCVLWQKGSRLKSYAVFHCQTSSLESFLNLNTWFLYLDTFENYKLSMSLIWGCVVFPHNYIFS